MKIFLPFLMLCILGSCQSSESTEPISKPNIIYIFTDDLGYGDIGCFGATDIATPHIDRIARDGLKFTSLYSASSVCSPSRAGLMTGRHPERMGIRGVFFPESYTGMPTEEVTMGDMLKSAGYSTGIVGKWHLGHRHEYLPLQRGFDYYYGIPYSNDMESVVYMKGNEVDSFFVNQSYTTKTYTEKALTFIDNHKDSPFFLYLAHNMPHVPIYASPAFLGTSNRGLYGDVIQEIDWSVGQVLQKLTDLSLLENTIVVFSSDNGPWLVMEDHGGSAGPLREGKQYTFEGGMRVPTVAMWPKKIPAGSVYEKMVAQMDWFPTFAQIVGVKLPADKQFDGEDISAVLYGEGDRIGDDYLFFNFGELEGYRKGPWKVKRPFKGYAGSRGKKAVAAHDSLFFNLEADISESANLHLQMEKESRALFTEMEKELEKMGPLPERLVLRTGSDNSHFKYLQEKRK